MNIYYQLEKTHNFYNTINILQNWKILKHDESMQSSLVDYVMKIVKERKIKYEINK